MAFLGSMFVLIGLPGLFPKTEVFVLHIEKVLAAALPSFGITAAIALFGMDPLLAGIIERYKLKKLANERSLQANRLDRHSKNGQCNINGWENENPELKALQKKCNICFYICLVILFVSFFTLLLILIYKSCRQEN